MSPFELSSGNRMFEEVSTQINKAKASISASKSSGAFFFGIQDIDKLKKAYFDSKGNLRPKKEISLNLYKLYNEDSKELQQ